MLANSGIPFDEWSGSGATDRLREAIVASSEATERQTRTMLRLTWAIAAMTALMLVGVVLQIVVAVRSLPGQ